MICAQIMAIGTLMHHPKEFAGKCQQTTAGNTFKDDLSAKEIKNYILNTVVEKQCTVNKGLSLWDEGSDEDKETAWTSRSCPRSRRRFEVQDNKENVPSMRSTPSSSRRTSSPFDSATNTHPLSRCRETARQSPVKKKNHLLQRSHLHPLEIDRCGNCYDMLVTRFPAFVSSSSCWCNKLVVVQNSHLGLHSQACEWVWEHNMVSG